MPGLALLSSDRCGARVPIGGASLIALALMFADPAAAGESFEREDDAAAVSEHDVTPILLRRCTVCHGLRRQEGELDLRSRAAMLRGGKSGPAIVPGDSASSRLVQKVRAGEMPPLRRVVEVSVKPIEPAELELVARWIDQGAPEAGTADSDSAPASDLGVKDRDFWSFQSPRAVDPPAGSSKHAANPIDAFILAKLHEKNLSLAPEADRLTLLRRAAIDLTGLPPEPGDVLAYMNDTEPDAYERLIDRLLASPRYGERWGRHWLDVAGYADSEGKTDQDLRRPFAWRYRDYVIQSFNADKPYDRFLLEQIAGDELAAWDDGTEITPEIYDNLVATGFLRMSPDGTFANITNFVPDRLEVIADAVQVLGSAVMGLTLHCARCHDHKLEPISQRDYYRLLDVFKGAYDEHDWLKPNVSEIAATGQWGYRLLPRVLPEERRGWEAQVARIDAETAQRKAAFEERTSQLKAKVVDERLAKLPAELTDDLRRMLATPPEKRDAVQKYLADKFEKSLSVDVSELKKLDDEFKKAADEHDKAVKELQAKRPPEPMIHALWDRGEPSPTFLLRRGDYLKTGPLVTPGVPAALAPPVLDIRPPWPGAKSTGRRLALARWLTRPDHPLTARVMANRIWRHHFGTGLVASLDNFGTSGGRPTHPELLDWLAAEFARQGWSVKAMHRLIMSSATYRQSSRVTSEHEQTDPDNRLYSRMPLRRIDAEVLYDSTLLVAGRLDQSRYGPPDAVTLSPDGLVTPAAQSEFWRRSIYVEQRRKQIPTLLENFDLPQMNPNCIERAESNVAPQALHLLNNTMIVRLAGHFGDRARREAGDDPKRRVEHVYLAALARSPTPEELELALAALEQWTEQWSRQPAAGSEPDGTASSTPAMRALATFCHTILNSAEFLYVD